MLDGDAVLRPMGDSRLHGQSQGDLVAGVETAMQDHEALAGSASCDSSAIDLDARLLTPGGNAQRERESDSTGGVDLEMNLFFEGIAGGLGDFNRQVVGPYGSLELRWAVENGGQAIVAGLHPHADGVVGKDAMHIGAAAGGGLSGVGLEGHHAAAVFHHVMVGVERSQELVGAGEILQRLPVFLDGSGRGIEAGALHAIGPGCIAGGDEHVTPRPGVVGNVAGLVGVERSDGAVPLGSGGNAVDEHVVIEDAALGGLRESQVLVFTRGEIEKGGQLHGFSVGAAVGIDGRGGIDAQRRQVSMLWVVGHGQVFLPGVPGQGKQAWVAGAGVGPQDGFDVGDVSGGRSVGGRVAKVVFPERLGNVDALRAAGNMLCIAQGCQAAKEHILRPAMEIAFGIFKVLWPQVAVTCGVGQRVVDGRAHLRHEPLIVEHQGQPRGAIEPIGLLLPRPPGVFIHAVYFFFARPIGAGKGPGDLRQLRTELGRLLLKHCAQPALGLNRSGSQRVQYRVRMCGWPRLRADKQWA